VPEPRSGPWLEPCSGPWLEQFVKQQGVTQPERAAPA
jgi:hypothetical protein